MNEQNNNVMSINTKDIEFKEVKGSPFTAVKQKNKWILVMGDCLLTRKQFEFYEDVEEFVNQKPWELIMTASSIFNEKIKKQNEDL